MGIPTFNQRSPTIIFDLSSFTYEINCENKIIKTVAAKSPSIITKWVEEIMSLYNGKSATVGFDINWQNRRTLLPWKKKKKPATLQFYIGGDCLTIQLCHVGVIPEALKRFLMNHIFTFAAVKDRSKMMRLNKVHGLQCSRIETVMFAKKALRILRLGRSNEVYLEKIKKPKHTYGSVAGKLRIVVKIKYYMLLLMLIPLSVVRIRCVSCFRC